MNNLVEIYNDKAICGTWIISQGFQRQHAKVTELCRKYETEFAELGDNTSLSKGFTIRHVAKKTAGKPFDEYLLNEAQTIFLGSMFRAKKGNDPVLRFKVQLAKDFVKQKKIIAALLNQRQSPEWIENRALGKTERKNETDTIKDFLEYCKKQGSLNAEKYYVNFTTAANSSLFDFGSIFANNRDMMTASQLKDVKFADKIVARGLIEGMALEMDYHDIYKMVKDRLISLGEMCGKSEIISQQLAIDW